MSGDRDRMSSRSSAPKHLDARQRRSTRRHPSRYCPATCASQRKAGGARQVRAVRAAKQCPNVSNDGPTDLRARQIDFLFVVKWPVGGFGGARGRHRSGGPVGGRGIGSRSRGVTSPKCRCPGVRRPRRRSSRSWSVLPGPAVQWVTRWASAMRCRNTTSLSRRFSARNASRGVLPSVSLRS
jgi:hypothetical protein